MWPSVHQTSGPLHTHRREMVQLCSGLQVRRGLPCIRPQARGIGGAKATRRHWRAASLPANLVRCRPLGTRTRAVWLCTGGLRYAQQHAQVSYLLVSGRNLWLFLMSLGNNRRAVGCSVLIFTRVA